MGLPVNRAHHRSLATLPGCICKASVQMAARPRRRVNCMRLHQRIGAAVQAAATGEAFLSAARGVGEMLTRHSMSAVAVWWLPNVVLQYTTLGIAAVAGVLTYYASNATWQHSNRHQAHMVRRVCTVPQPLHAVPAVHAVPMQYPFHICTAHVPPCQHPPPASAHCVRIGGGPAPARVHMVTAGVLRPAHVPGHYCLGRPQSAVCGH